MKTILRTCTRPHARPQPLALPVALALAVALPVALAGCGGSGSDSPAPSGGGGSFDSQIHIVAGAFNKGGMAFSPETDTVHVNQVVRIQNDDSVLHNITTVTAGGPSWGAISAGGFKDATATAAGTFQFHCIVAGHTMSGTLVVLP
jgi:plastocyanin